MADRSREDPRLVVPKLERSRWTVDVAWPGRAIAVTAIVVVLLRAPIAVFAVPPNPGPVALYHWPMRTLGVGFLSGGPVSLLDRSAAGPGAASGRRGG